MENDKFKSAVWKCIDNPKEFYNQDFNDNQSSFVSLLVTILRKKIIETKKQVKLEIRDQLTEIRSQMDILNPMQTKQQLTNLIKELK